MQGDDAPQDYRKRLRTAIGVERLNQEIRRCVGSNPLFPNEESAFQLIGALYIAISIWRQT
nr:transposase [Moorella sp. E308F]